MGDNGIRHFGVVVDDVEEWTANLEAMGAPCVVGRADIPSGAHAELKFLAPDGVVFDIIEKLWPGTEAAEPLGSKKWKRFWARSVVVSVGA